MNWPEKQYPGDTPDVGYDAAMSLFEEVPPDKRVYTLDEISNMFTALGELPNNEAGWRSWAEEHVEHMATGGYLIGKPDTQ